MAPVNFGFWLTRRIPSLSVLVLLLLFYVALYCDPGLSAKRKHRVGDDGPWARGFRHGPGTQHDHGSAASLDIMTYSRRIFVLYMLTVHLLALIFPIRASWAIWNLIKDIRNVEPTWQPKVMPVEKSMSPSELSPTTSLRSLSPSTSSSSEGSRFVDVSEDETLKKGPIHAIILPNYREDIEILRETLEVLACHPQASTQYDVYLAMEQRESNSLAKAVPLVSEFSSSFRRIKYTMHPGDIIGEAPGKSSNLAWAAKEACIGYSMHLSQEQRKNVIVTVMDSDSHLSANFFSAISSMHSNFPQTALTTIYVPPIIFDRNCTSVPTMVRIADLLWSAAGISGLYDSSAIRPPTSVYAVPLALVDLVGGWDAGPDAIGEDLHMYIKCFFTLGGNLTTRTVLSAVSQTNVSSDETGIRGYLAGHRARYKQAIRHMWGSLDTGYAFRRLLSLCWHGIPINYGSPRLSPRVDTFQKPHPRPNATARRSSGATPISAPSSANRLHIIILFHRLYEAHFLPTHFVALILASALYTLFKPAGSIPPEILWTFNICGYLRALGFVCMLCMFSFYARFHDLCVSRREDEMERAGLAQQMKGSFARRSLRLKVLDCCLFPVAGMVFGSVPALHAQMKLLWTVNLVYSVSRKPVRLGVAAVVNGLEVV